MRPRDPSGRPHETDQLTPFDRVAWNDQRVAQMEVAGYEACAVVDEHGRAAVIEIRDEGHNAAVRRADRRAPLGAEVHAVVTAAHDTVEHPRHAEAAGHRARAGPHERRLPQARRLVGPLADFLYDVALDPDAFGQRIRRPGNPRRDPPPPAAPPPRSPARSRRAR